MSSHKLVYQVTFTCWFVIIKCLVNIVSCWISLFIILLLGVWSPVGAAWGGPFRAATTGVEVSVDKLEWTRWPSLPPPRRLHPLAYVANVALKTKKNKNIHNDIDTISFNQRTIFNGLTYSRIEPGRGTSCVINEVDFAFRCRGLLPAFRQWP